MGNLFKFYMEHFMVTLIIIIVFLAFWNIYLTCRLNDSERYLHDSVISRISRLEHEQLIIPKGSTNKDLLHSIEDGYKESL